MRLDLATIQAVLGVHKSTASLLRNGRYDRDGSDLPQRYQALVVAVEQAKTDGGQVDPDLLAICKQCPRTSCAGCRVAEIQQEERRGA